MAETPKHRCSSHMQYEAEVMSLVCQVCRRIMDHPKAKKVTIKPGDVVPLGGPGPERLRELEEYELREDLKEMLTHLRGDNEG